MAIPYGGDKWLGGDKASKSLTSKWKIELEFNFPANYQGGCAAQDSGHVYQGLYQRLCGAATSCFAVSPRRRSPAARPGGRQATDTKCQALSQL